MPAVIPELVLVVGLFFAVVGYLFARGALATWTHTVGFLLHAIASALVFSIPLGFRSKKIDLGGPVRALDNAVVSAIQAWADGAEIEMGYCLHGLAHVAQYMAQAIDILGRETAHTFDWLVHVHIPRWVKYAATAAFPFAWITKVIAAQIAKALPHIRTEIHTVTHDLPRVTVKVLRQTIGGAVALPPWVIHLPRRLRRDEAALGRHAKRLGRVEGLFAAGVMAGVLANVLGIATKCLRTGNVGKTARRLCGLDANLLESLLLDGLIIASAISVVEFAEAMLAIEDEAVKILQVGIREFPS